MAITYTVATNIITVTGYTEATPCNFTDIYNADKADTLSLHARTGISAVDGATVAVDRAERPSDYVVLGGASNDLYITIANWVGTTATIRITGTNRDGAAQTEDIVVTANGNYYTTKWFKTITHTQVTVFTATGFDYDLTQGQWGVVSRQSSNQFYFNAVVTIGDGTIATWFNDIQKSIIIKYDWIIKANATLWFGVLENATDKQTSNGVNLFSDNTVDSVLEFKNDGGTLHFYSCSFSELQTDGSFGKILGANNIYNCILHHIWILETCNGDIYRTTIQKGGTGINSCSAAFEDILITDMSNYGIIVNNALPAETTMKNVKIRDAQYAVRLYGFGVSASQALYLVNPDFDSWTFSYYYATNGTVYRQYEFDLKVIDKDNTPIQTATVKIWDKDSNLIVDTTTDANGIIATQTISRGYYNQANGNTLQEYSPHLIKIEKAGYTTYEADFTLGAKTDWLVALQVGGVASKNVNLSKRCRINM